MDDIQESSYINCNFAFVAAVVLEEVAPSSAVVVGYCGCYCPSFLFIHQRVPSMGQAVFESGYGGFNRSDIQVINLQYSLHTWPSDVGLKIIGTPTED